MINELIQCDLAIVDPPFGFNSRPRKRATRCRTYSSWLSRKI